MSLSVSTLNKLANAIGAADAVAISNAIGGGGDAITANTLTFPGGMERGVFFGDEGAQIYGSGSHLVLSVDSGNSGVLFASGENPIETAAFVVNHVGAGVPSGKFLLLDDEANILFGDGDGSMIGTEADQKFAFWGAEPIVQPAGIADATEISGGQSPTEEEHNEVVLQLNAVLATLRSLGLIAPDEVEPE